MARMADKVKSGRSLEGLAGHVLRLIRPGSETPALVSSHEHVHQESSVSGLVEQVAPAMLGIECKKAQAIVEYQRSHRGF